MYSFKYKMCCLVLSIILLMFCAVNTFSLTLFTPNYNKISKDLLIKMSDVEKNDGYIFDVFVWFVDAENIDSIRNAFLLNCETKQLNTQGSIEYLRLEYLQSINTIYESHNSKMARIIDNNNINYVSKFSPVVFANLSKNEILNLSKSDDVLMICDNSYEQLEESIFKTTSTESSTRFDYDGSGIKIGILDSGIPSSQFLSNYNISSSNCHGSVNGDHVEFVTEICMDYASNSTYYFAGGYVNDTYTPAEVHLEWLLSQGVDIINISLRYDGLNTYTDFTRWIDHIAYTHFVLITKSAGNLGSDGVTSPGMGYNVITVGALDYSNGVFTHMSFSSYSNVYDSLFKPDISAIGIAGTSEAAPRVCGVAAKLMQVDYSLRYSPEALKAILLASVNTNTLNFVPSYRFENTTSYMQVGSGILDEDNAIYVTSSSYPTVGSYYSSYLTYDSSYDEITFTVNQINVGMNVYIAMTYLAPVEPINAHTSGNSTTPDVPNLNLYLYSPNSNIEIASSITLYNNVEKIVYEISQPGTYTIRVARVGTTIEDIPYGVSWMFY